MMCAYSNARANGDRASLHRTDTHRTLCGEVIRRHSDITEGMFELPGMQGELLELRKSASDEGKEF